jgi:acetoacetyl-CoA synthetase
LQQQFPQTQIISLSGGSDVCTAFVGGHTDMPVIPGEIQCKMLGAAVEVWSADGNSITETPGELVLTAPLLSMPIYLLDDSNFLRYRQSYFAMFDTVWNHGDWAAITKNGGIVIYGRSDATLNRFGVRIGTAEIYAALAQFQGIDDALMVHLQHEDKDELVLFIQSDTEWEYEEIKSHIRKTCSPRHVPDQILSAPEIPYTISGKKVEIPVKRLLQGEKLENVISLDALKNPNAMQWFLKAFG